MSYKLDSTQYLEHCLETTTARLDEVDKHHSYRQTATTSSTNQENKAKSSNNTAQEPPTQPSRIDTDFATTSAPSSSTSIKGFSTITLVLVLGTKLMTLK